MNGKSRWFWLLLAIVVGVMIGYCYAVFVQFNEHSTDRSAAVNDAKQLLLTQQEAWNKGDLKGFLAEYEMSNGLTFFSDSELPPGWVALSDRFTKKYGNGQTSMGHLEFTDLFFTPFGRNSVMVRGRWTTGPEHTGLFTILVKKTDTGWKIVHDHTSERKASPER